MQRFFTTKEFSIEDKNKKLLLPDDIFHHLVHVLRMKKDDCFELVTTNENGFIAKILDVDKKKGYFEIVSELHCNSELPVDVTIACGVSKGDKAEEIVKKGTQLGANNFIFFNSQYSVARWNNKKQVKKIQRLQTIAQNAAEQSHRMRIPNVKFISGLTELIEISKSCNYSLVAYEESAKNGEKNALSDLVIKLKKHGYSSIISFFGPEGGISPEEIEQLCNNNFICAALGPRILRAETAPLYFLSALSFGLELE
nr:16S rRNA (uracil(1498)-N(3))-methyltransferase [uncultured Ligilactobacillus sp.]